MLDWRALPRHGPHAALHRVHGRRRTRTAGGSTTSCRRRRSSRRSAPSSRSSRSTPAYRGEVAERWRYVGRQRRDRRDRLGDRSRSAATARARGSRPTGKLYTCLFAVRGSTSAQALLRSGVPRRRASTETIGAVWDAARRPLTPEPPHGGDLEPPRGSRCPSGGWGRLCGQPRRRVPVRGRAKPATRLEAQFRPSARSHRSRDGDPRRRRRPSAS